MRVCPVGEKENRERMKNHMLIRDMQLQDFEKVNTVMQEVHALHVKNRPDLYIDVEEPYARDKFEADIDNENMVTVLAEENGEIMGICMASFRQQTCMVKSERRIWMCCVFVSHTEGEESARSCFYMYRRKPKQKVRNGWT